MKSPAKRLPGRSRPTPAGAIELQIVRTVPEKIYTAVPRGDFRILESYLRAIQAAQQFIYLENQFLWSPEITAALHAKLVNPPSPDFRLLLLLPAKPNTGSDDTRGVLGELIEADDDDARMLACTLYARSGPRADPVYVHAKIAIIDDAWLTLGSANLNEHSLFNDTEMNFVAHDPDLASQTRLRLWAEHLELPIDEVPTRPDESDRRALETDQQRTARTPRAKVKPLTHRLVRLPNVSRRSGRALGPFSGILVDG